MTQVPFPVESAALATIQKALSYKPSAAQVRIAIQELTDLSDQNANKVFQSGLFEKAFDRMEEITREDISVNQQISEGRRSLNELQITMQYLDPEQIAESLSLIQEKIALIQDPSTFFLKSELALLKKQWQHVYFLYTFPIAEELRDDSMQNNTFYKIQQKIERADFQESARLTECLLSYLRHLHAAEEIFLEGKLKSYALLEEEIREDFERQVSSWEGLPLKELLQDASARRELAALLMNQLEDRLFSGNL